jgi:hypothetical protein
MQNIKEDLIVKYNETIVEYHVQEDLVFTALRQHAPQYFNKICENFNWLSITSWGDFYQSPWNQDKKFVDLLKRLRDVDFAIHQSHIGETAEEFMEAKSRMYSIFRRIWGSPGSPRISDEADLKFFAIPNEKGKPWSPPGFDAPDRGQWKKDVSKGFFKRPSVKYLYSKDEMEF